MYHFNSKINKTTSVSTHPREGQRKNVFQNELFGLPRAPRAWRPTQAVVPSECGAASPVSKLQKKDFFITVSSPISILWVSFLKPTRASFSCKTTSRTPDKHQKISEDSARVQQTTFRNRDARIQQCCECDCASAASSALPESPKAADPHFRKQCNRLSRGRLVRRTS